MTGKLEVSTSIDDCRAKHVSRLVKPGNAHLIVRGIPSLKCEGNSGGQMSGTISISLWSIQTERPGIYLVKLAKQLLELEPQQAVRRRQIAEVIELTLEHTYLLDFERILTTTIKITTRSTAKPTQRR